MAFEKTVLEAGSGLYCPNRLARVVVSLTGKWYTSDGDDVTFDRRENELIQLDQANNELTQTLEDIICTLKPGEKAQFLLHSGHQLISNSMDFSSNPLPPMGAEVVYIVHLHSFEQGKEVWKLTDQERLDIAKIHKEKGTVLFKANNFIGASIRYSKSVQYLSAVDPDTPLEVKNLEDYEKEILSVRAASLSNLAACQLKFGQYDHVVTNCTQVLELDSRNVKGWYRRAKALLAMKDFECARSDLLKAWEIDPGNQAVGELMKSVDMQESVHNAKFKDALKTMFSNQ